MKLSLPSILAVSLSACAGQTAALNADLSPPVSPEIARGFALRDRYNLPKYIGTTAIFVDSVSVHFISYETSTIVWKDSTGRWQRSQVSETGGVAPLPPKKNLNSNVNEPLSEQQSMMLDRLIANSLLYREKTQATGPQGPVGSSSAMAIVTPFGRTVVRWEGRLEGLSGAVADIVLSEIKEAKDPAS
jgi:hypothetical protein